jgi:hypothetical protein
MVKVGVSARLNLSLAQPYVKLDFPTFDVAYLKNLFNLQHSRQSFLSQVSGDQNVGLVDL